VTVCTVDRSRFYPVDTTLESILPKSIKVVRTKTWESVPLKILGQKLLPFLLYCPDPMRFWGRRSSGAIIDLVRDGNFDVVLSWAQPFSVHSIGRAIKRQLGLPWAAHFSDPLVDNPFYYGFRFNPHKGWNSKFEEMVVTTADQTHFVSKVTIDQARARYQENVGRKFHYVPHCFDRSLYDIEPPPPRDSQVIIAHVGTFTGKRNPQRLLNVLAKFRKSEPKFLDGITFQFVGPYKQSYVDFCQKFDLDQHVAWIGSVSFLKSLAYMKAADQLLIIDGNFDGTSVFFPSKLIDYLGSERPILAITPPAGATAQVLRELGLNEFADPDNEEEIEELLRRRMRDPQSYTNANNYDVGKISADLTFLLSKIARA
jgi:glycosyltransferase involved in cell wall biosynthesis